MNYVMPGEKWNRVRVPLDNLDSVDAKSYVMSEMVYRLPNVEDVMMVKEFWHTVCDFAERCGSLLERVTGTIKSSGGTLTLAVESDDPATPTFGTFQRFVGAGVNGQPVGFGSITTDWGADGPEMTFDAALTDTTGKEAWIDFSVVPDVNAVPAKQIAPRWFLKRYQRALLAGTMMRLCGMDGRAWTDAAGARMNATTYLREIDRTTRMTLTSGMRRSVLIDAEAVLARQSTTVNSQTQTSTVG